MENTMITNAMATNAAFHEIFTRLTKLTARAADPWTRIARDQVIDRRARPKELHGQLKSERASAASLGALRDALGELGTSIGDVVGEATELAEDAVELVRTMPGAFALMTRDEKREAIKQILARPELESRLLPGGPAQDGTQTQYCKAILSLDVIECVLAILVALVTDIAAEVISGGLATPVIVGVAIIEVVMFIIAIVIAALSYQDCIG